MKQFVYPFLVAIALSSCTGETVYYNQDIDLESYIHGEVRSNESDVSISKGMYESALQLVDFAKNEPTLLTKKKLEKAKREYKNNLEDLRDKISDYLKAAKAANGTQDTMLYVDFGISDIILLKHFVVTTYRINNVEYVERRLKRLNEDLKELD